MTANETVTQRQNQVLSTRAMEQNSYATFIAVFPVRHVVLKLVIEYNHTECVLLIFHMYLKMITQNCFCP